ncbi:unnamed protein product [Laminaria digitata]
MTLELAVVLHRLGKTEAAGDLYVKVLGMEGASQDGTRDLARSNLAVLKQEVGDFEGAVEGYRQVLVDLPESAPLLNNLGTALLTLGKTEEGVSMLKKAIELDPTQHDVLVNLGTHLQEEGDLDGARAIYTSAGTLRINGGLAVRHAIMLAPILTSEEDIAREKDQLHRAVDELIARDPPLVIPDPIQGVERVHFYLVYRGGNHRVTQQKIARMYALATPGLLYVAPHFDADVPPSTRGVSEAGESAALLQERSPSNDGVGGGSVMPEATNASLALGVTTEEGLRSSSSPPLRVGFVSKFFGDEEPHGMLLGGAMKHLPRSHFHIILCPIATPGRRTSPSLLEAADEVVQIPLKVPVARGLLGDLRLDVLIYADMNSEPVSHFLGYARLARVQAVFWGNPITTGEATKKATNSHHPH